MKNCLNNLISSIIAGLFISIGGMVYITLYNIDKISGALLFSIGLFVIVNYKFSLFTGKIGYLFTKDKKYLIDLLITLLGNFIGALFSGLLFKLTRMGINCQEVVNDLVNNKLNDSWNSILILSFFCGILVYIGVDGFKNLQNYGCKIFILVISVTIFILCGFEHSIANFFYFSTSNIFSLKLVLYAFLIVIGNSLGAITLNLLINLCIRNKKEEDKNKKAI